MQPLIQLAGLMKKALSLLQDSARSLKIIV
jgi:hypothetical protein